MEKDTTKKIEVEEINDKMRPSGIVVNDPNAFRPKVLPLIVILPEGANKAQQERAKVLNGYAYQFPDKWVKEKEKHLQDLEALANEPDPIENGNVKLFVGSKIPS